MNLGDVYIWETESVQGHDKRKKRHVFICPEDSDDANIFLFINKQDWYGDYKILKSNYEQFLEYDSFVGCNSIVTYTSDYLRNVSIQLVGQITNQDLKGIRDAIIAAETMERRHANKVCKALAAAL
ncbi:MAG: hypothetical protein R3D62_15585 [Xanthobacteraceae bacterium]